MRYRRYRRGRAQYHISNSCKRAADCRRLNLPRELFAVTSVLFGGSTTDSILRPFLALRQASEERLRAQMILKRRGNPRWSESVANSLQPTVSEFERVVERLRLEPQEYIGSQELRAWAEKNKDVRFVPERLLKAWGIPLRRNIEDFM